MATLSLSIIEIIVLMAGALMLGITIHFFITSRKNFKATTQEKTRKTSSMDEWKLKYFNEVEQRDKELNLLKQQLTELQDSSHINLIEAEEMRKENKKLGAELVSLRKLSPQQEKPAFMAQLAEAQASLLDNNEKISHLLFQIEGIKEAEEKQQELQRNNEALAGQVGELKSLLAEKEKEIEVSRQKQQITTEVSQVLDNAYTEFNALQEKIRKLEAQLNSARTVSIQYEDLKEAHFNLTRELNEERQKHNATSLKFQQLQSEFTDYETRLRDANYQRQQLQKRISYLEELNKDLQVVSDANQRLEGQLKRLGELESMLNIVSGERDELARKHQES